MKKVWPIPSFSYLNEYIQGLIIPILTIINYRQRGLGSTADKITYNSDSNRVNVEIKNLNDSNFGKKTDQEEVIKLGDIVDNINIVYKKKIIKKFFYFINNIRINYKIFFII